MAPVRRAPTAAAILRPARTTGSKALDQLLGGGGNDLLWGGAYPKWLKERIGGPFGHLDNLDSARLLGALVRSKLKHVIGAHLSQQNNRPELARAALAGAMGCEAGWIGIATQEEGFGWREI